MLAFNQDVLRALSPDAEYFGETFYGRTSFYNCDFGGFMG